VQRASIAAWSDEEHVQAVREVYRRKRDVVLPALEAKGLRLSGSTATFYLWIDVGGPSIPFAEGLLEHGVVCAPGAFFGPAGEGYVRFALVPTQEDCERAAAIIERVL
jgi:acetylornithine aminotransferase